MEKVTLTINGQEVEAPQGAILLEVTRKRGIYIPSLCYIEGLPPYAGCRMCVVELEGVRGVQLACTTPVTAGMVARTHTPELEEMRRGVLELIISNHPDRCLTCHKNERCGPGETCLRDDVVTHRCLTCAKNKRCELLSSCEQVGTVWWERYYFEKGSYYSFAEKPPIDQGNPYLEFDPKMCILCARCIRACDEIRHTTAIGLGFRGTEATIVFGAGGPVHESSCDFCGACIDVCPTATLMEHPHKWAWKPDRWVPTICSYCSVGCALRVGLKRDRITQIKPQVGSPINGDQLCVRGRFHYDAIPRSGRLERPALKRGQELAAVEWDEALEEAASRLEEVQRKHGGEGIGCLISGTSTNEEAYLFQKLARAILKTNNIDQSAMFFHRPLMEGISGALEFGINAGTLADLRSARCIVVVGGDPTGTHPVAALKVKDAARRYGVKLLIMNPKRTELVHFADLWLRYRPGSEVALLNGLARSILEERRGMLSSLGLQGLQELEASLADYTAEKAADIAGVSAEEIRAGAELLLEASQGKGEGPQVIFLFGGIQAPRERVLQTAKAVANLALLVSGAPGRGSGLYVLPPEANHQGVCDMGALPDLLPGYLEVEESEPRSRFEEAWETQLPSSHGLTVYEMLTAAKEGRIKALLVLGDNPLMGLPNRGWVEGCLRSLELLIVIDSLASDTAKLAHILLPGAGFFEKEGTFTSGDRRVQHLHEAVPPPGAAKAQWWILCQLAARLQGPKEARECVYFDYGGPAEIMEEIRRWVPPYWGAAYPDLGRIGFQVTTPGDVVRQPGLLHAAEHIPLGSDGDYPLTLMIGRPLYSSLEAATLHAEEIDKFHRENFLEINPRDALALGVVQGEQVEAESRSGALSVRVKLTEDVPAGAAFLPSLYGGGTAYNLLDEGATWRLRIRKAE